MRVSQGLVDAMPASSLKQVEKREKAASILEKAQGFEKELQAKVSALRELDGKEEDKSPTDDVVITLKGERDGKEYDYTSTVAKFQNDSVDVEYHSEKRDTVKSWGTVKRAVEDTHWSVQTEDGVTRYFEDEFTVDKERRLGIFFNVVEGAKEKEYTFRQLTVTETAEGKVYEYREGSGTRHRIWNGIRSTASAVGGAVAATWNSLPRIRFEVEENQETLS